MLDEARCLREGPLATTAQTAIAAAADLGASSTASTLRASCVVQLFEDMERVFASGDEPTSSLLDSLERLTAGFRAARAAAGASGEPAFADATAGALDAAMIAETTGQHYGGLFRQFSGTSYWDEPVRLLRTRLERNGIAIESFEGARALDSGCGGGRYTAAWRLLGAGTAVGIDVSRAGLDDARARVREAALDGVEFREGNVLEIPFGDAAFDVVFSNGVLHHTTDWVRGVHELVRVLKPGGWGWLYVIENPGGLFWDVIEILRVLTRGERRETMRAALATMGVPANRAFYMLDHVMVPINMRLAPADVEASLASAGATAIRRLTRGADFDRIERIHQRDPYAAVKYGVGENRYVFTRA